MSDIADSIRENEDQFYRENPQILALPDFVRLRFKTFIFLFNWYDELCKPIDPTNPRSLQQLTLKNLLEMPEIFYDYWARLSLTRLLRDAKRHPIMLEPVIRTYCERKLVATECEVNTLYRLPRWMLKTVKHLKVTGPQSPPNETVRIFFWSFDGVYDTLLFENMDMNVTYNHHLCGIRAEILMLRNCNFVGLSDVVNIGDQCTHLVLYNCYITDSNEIRIINSINQIIGKLINCSVVYIFSDGEPIHFSNNSDTQPIQYQTLFDTMGRIVYQKVLLCDLNKDLEAQDELLELLLELSVEVDDSYQSSDDSTLHLSDISDSYLTSDEDF